MVTNNKGMILIVILFALVIIGGVGFFLLGDNNTKVEPVGFDSPVIKITIPYGDSVSRKLGVMSNVDRDIDILVSKVGDDEDMLTLEDNMLLLKANSKENLLLNFSSTAFEPGVYVFRLDFEYEKNDHFVPVIIEIQSKDVLFDSNINLFPIGAEFSPGERFVSEINIYDLVNKGKSNVDLKYVIRNLNGEEIVNENEEVVVDGKFIYSKEVSLPDATPNGDYVLSVALDYDGSVGTSSSIFKVIDKKSFENNNLIILVIGFFGFLVVLMTIFSVYLFFIRDSLMKEITAQYKSEIRKQNKILEDRRRKDYNLLRNRLERSLYDKQFVKIKSARDKEIKKIYSERKKKVAELKRSSNKKGLDKQLAEWKKKGYDTKILDKKFKSPSVNEIKRKVKEWKKKGYDTTVLEGKDKF